MPKISELTEATSLSSDDLFIIVHSGTNNKIAASNLSVPVNDAQPSNLTGFVYSDGTSIHAAGTVDSTSAHASIGDLDFACSNGKFSTSQGRIAASSISLGTSGGPTTIQLNTDGSAFLATGTLSIDTSGHVVIAGLQVNNSGPTTIQLNQDGSAYFAHNAFYIDQYGSISASSITLGGVNSISNSGLLTVGLISSDGTVVRTDGSGNFNAGTVTCNSINSDDGAFVSDGGGNLTANSISSDHYAINSDGSFSFNGISGDTSGKLTTSGLGVNGDTVVNGDLTSVDNVNFTNLPTSDPANLGTLWCDTTAGFVIKVSQG